MVRIPGRHVGPGLGDRPIDGRGTLAERLMALDLLDQPSYHCPWRSRHRLLSHNRQAPWSTVFQSKEIRLVWFSPLYCLNGVFHGSSDLGRCHVLLVIMAYTGSSSAGRSWSRRLCILRVQTLHSCL
jgi:hypothetical protein